MKELKGPDWTSTPVTSGLRVVNCTSWNGFSSFVDLQLANFDAYIYRGHAKEEWKLEPTLDRALADKKLKSIEGKRNQLLEKFKHASRGRRGPNPNSNISENDWWALGQHHGLFTPLLDWSESPYVAAYFALMNDITEFDENIVVYGLNRNLCEKRNTLIKKSANNVQDRDAKCIEFIRPLTDENPRLISQRGLFTRVPDHVTIEEWVHTTCEYSKESGACLLKILIPNFDKHNALKSLNRMNINHLSLFPDLDGASKYCNTSLIINRY